MANCVCETEKSLCPQHRQARQLGSSDKWNESNKSKKTKKQKKQVKARIFYKISWYSDQAHIDINDSLYLCCFGQLFVHPPFHSFLETDRLAIHIAEGGACVRRRGFHKSAALVRQVFAVMLNPVCVKPKTECFLDGKKSEYLALQKKSTALCIFFAIIIIYQFWTKHVSCFFLFVTRVKRVKSGHVA